MGIRPYGGYFFRDGNRFWLLKKVRGIVFTGKKQCSRTLEMRQKYEMCREQDQLGGK